MIRRSWIWIAGILLLAGGGTAALLTRPGGIRPEQIVVAAIWLAWLGLLVGYYIWAIRRYNVNYGLTDEEWKVAAPQIYAESGELQEYEERHRELVAARRGPPMDDENGANGKAGGIGLDLPAENPYANDSFGLPPGTLRGTFALTALVMFLTVEIVNLFQPGTEKEFGELITAFEMVLAFYFGSRAVEALWAKRKPSDEEHEHHHEPWEESRPAPVPERVSIPELVAPSERPAMPAYLQLVRNVSLVTDAATPAAPASPATPSTSGLSPADPLLKRVLALTASFETGLLFPRCFGVVAGDFDGQGLSYGALQWCLGQGSLQPLWRRMREAHRAELESALGDLCDELCRMLDMSSLNEQLKWARSIQVTRKVGSRTVPVVTDRWKKALSDLGATPGMIGIQLSQAMNRYDIATSNCREYGLTSERGVALMFDINVQNGKVDQAGAGARIRQDFENIPDNLPAGEAEQERLVIIATRRAEVTKAEWRQDVLTRKLTVARGTGVVHGRRYDLEQDFAIALSRPLQPQAAPSAIPAVGAVSV